VALAIAAIAMSICIPFAYASDSSGGGGGGSDDGESSYGQQPIPGLSVSDLVARTKSVLPDAAVSRTSYGGTHQTTVDNNSSTDELLSGSISIDADGSSDRVTEVDCDVDTTHGEQSPITQFCAGLQYDGGDPAGTTAWMQQFFTSQGAGTQLQQTRGGVQWTLSIDQYQPVILDFRVSVAGPYS
jgi:hypothetical protein